MKFRFKKIFKVLGLVLLIVIIGVYTLIYHFSKPKSDKELIQDYKKENIDLHIKTNVFNVFKYRVLSVQEKIDTSKVSIVFVHGSIGSANDFKNYLVAQDLRERANLIAYDRVGYGIHQTGSVHESIKFETELLEDLLKNFKTEKVLLVGYSYGGPIVLASFKNYKSVVLLAPAVSAEVEPMPWVVNFYRWKLTRWLLPKVWQAASKEKLSHALDLKNYENKWQKQPSKVISIHGNSDWIVPFENSLYLKEKFSKKQFKLVELNNVGHELVWTRFDEIKSVLLQQL